MVRAVPDSDDEDSDAGHGERDNAASPNGGTAIAASAVGDDSEMEKSTGSTGIS